MNLRTRAPRLSARSALLGATSAFCLLAPSAPASAEDAADADADAIVITGSAIQNQAEIDTRRKSEAIIDSLSRDEIGAMPDLTIAESMRRITGVTTIYNDDIGQFASIRGTHPDLIPVTMNGLAIATTGDLGEGTRRVNLQVIPGEAVRQIQVFKTLSPELESGALGGLINIVPVSAFDANEPVLIATGGLSYSSYMDVPDDNSAGDGKDSPIGKSASLLWASPFGTNEEFGLVLSALYEDRPRTQSNWAVTNRLYYNDAGGASNPERDDWNGFAAPNSFVTHNYTNKFQKYGGTARLEYRPSDRFETGLFGYAYFADEQETRNTNRVFSLDQPQDLTETTGSMRVRQADTQWRYNTFERSQAGVQWQTIGHFGDSSQLSANLGYSHATFLSERPFVSFVYRPNKRLTYDLSDPVRPFELEDGETYLDPANYALGDTYHDWREAEEDVWEARADYAFNSDAGDRGFGFGLGANYRRMELERDVYGTWFEAGTLALEGLSFIPDFATPGYSHTPLWIDQVSFWGDAVDGVPVDDDTTDYNNRISDYLYVEDVYAGYASARFATDAFILSGGFRLDHTRSDATTAQVVDGELQDALITNAGSYTSLLPYLTAVANLTPSLRLKLGASQTLGRPNPEDIATVETVDRSDLQITRGNPLIDPRRSTNLDLGLEYFFNGGQGMVTLTGFYKRIRDDILIITTQEEIDGELWVVAQPINGETTKYKGFEFGFINNSFGNIHPVLERLGGSANLMVVDGTSGFLYQGERRVRDELQYQAKFTANAAAFVALGRGSELRLAMNHLSGYVESYAANPWQDLWIKPFTTFDLTAKWALAPNWQLRLEGRNIFGANRFRNTGPRHEHHRAALEIGNSWFLRLTYLM